MDDETRAAFDAVLDEMRRGFAAVNQRFGLVDQRFGEIDQRFGEIDQRFGEIDQRFGEMNLRFGEIGQGFEAVTEKIRQHGVLVEDLRRELQAVAEGGRINARAIETLRAEMHERFRENEVIVGGAVRQIRRDLDELREGP